MLNGTKRWFMFFLVAIVIPKLFYYIRTRKHPNVARLITHCILKAAL
jgi:hypothetical protein